MQHIIQQLAEIGQLKNICHEQGNSVPMPSVETLSEVVRLARSLLFPGYFGEAAINEQTLLYHIGIHVERLQGLLAQQIKSGLCFDDTLPCDANLERTAQDKATAFIGQLPDLRRLLQTDVEAAYNGDPAAKSYGEVIFCYPAIRAISNYRIAHALLRLEVPLIPRIITEMAHSETGIDIQTAVIGHHVKLYQGVTLGAKSFPLDEAGNPIKGIDRHPKIGNHVIIYANSTILGNIHVGDGAVIGGNIWVDKDVPAGATLRQNALRAEAKGKE